MMMPPPRFPPTIPLFFVSSSSLVGFCYLTPSSYYCPFPPHLPPSPLSHSLSPCSLSVCLPLPLNENTHRCVKGRSNSTYPPVAAAASLTLSLWGREQGTTILLDNSSGPRREAQARPRSPPVWSRTLFARITAQKTPQQQQPERTQGTRVLSQKKNLQGPGSDARMLASSSSSTPPPSPFSSSSSSLKLLLLVCGDPEIAAACLEVVWESVWDVGFICGSYIFS